MQILFIFYLLNGLGLTDCNLLTSTKLIYIWIVIIIYRFRIRRPGLRENQALSDLPPPIIARYNRLRLIEYLIVECASIRALDICAAHTLYIDVALPHFGLRLQLPSRMVCLPRASQGTRNIRRLRHRNGPYTVTFLSIVLRVPLISRR